MKIIIVTEKHEINDEIYNMYHNNSKMIIEIAKKKSKEIGRHHIAYSCFNPCMLKENNKYYIIWERRNNNK